MKAGGDSLQLRSCVSIGWKTVWLLASPSGAEEEHIWKLGCLSGRLFDNGVKCHLWCIVPTIDLGEDIRYVHAFPRLKYAEAFHMSYGLRWQLGVVIHVSIYTNIHTVSK
jgi:hypothetical protein